MTRSIEIARRFTTAAVLVCSVCQALLAGLLGVALGVAGFGRTQMILFALLYLLKTGQSWHGYPRKAENTRVKGVGG